jgi:hypothetical protein
MTKHERLHIHWLFQANTEYFDLPRALRSASTITWIVTRYRQQMLEGDSVALWLSGAHAGVYGLGHIESFVTAPYNRPDSSFWLDKTDRSYVGKEHAIIRVDQAFAEQPLLKARVRMIPALSDLSVVKAPIGTNFKVTRSEWKALISELERREPKTTASQGT